MAVAVAASGSTIGGLSPISPVLCGAAEPIVLPVPAAAVKVLPRWAEEDGVTRWRLQYRVAAVGETEQPSEENMQPWTELELRDFTRELPLVGLQHGAVHFFKVAVETPNGWSDWSTPVACTPPSPQLPGKCAAVFAIVKDDTTALVRWTKPIDYAAAVNCGEIQRYKLTVAWPTGHRDIIINGDVDSYLVPDLECLTDYRFQVAAENVTGWGDHSDMSPVLNMPPPVPPRLQQPTLRRATHHTAVIQWQHPPASSTPVDSFSFRHTTAEDFPEGTAMTPDVTELHDIAPNLSQFLITKLKPGQRYIFQVRAINKYGMGIWSDNSIPIHTSAGKAPNKINDLSVPNLYRSFITLRWHPAEENGYEVTKHLLRYATKSDMSDAQEMVPTVARSGDFDSCDLKHLKKASYLFQVAAVNEAGMSEWSDPISVDLTGEKQLENA